MGSDDTSVGLNESYEAVPFRTIEATCDPCCKSLESRIGFADGLIVSPVSEEREWAEMGVLRALVDCH